MYLHIWGRWHCYLSHTTQHHIPGDNNFTSDITDFYNNTEFPVQVLRILVSQGQVTWYIGRALLHTLSSSSTGHWYTSSYSSKHSQSFAICPTSSHSSPVLSANCSHNVDFPTPGVPVQRRKSEQKGNQWFRKTEKYAPGTELNCTFQKTNSQKCFLLVFTRALKIQ